MACMRMATRTRYGLGYLQSISPPQSMSISFSSNNNINTSNNNMFHLDQVIQSAINKGRQRFAEARQNDQLALIGFDGKQISKSASISRFIQSQNINVEEDLKALREGKSMNCKSMIHLRTQRSSINYMVPKYPSLKGKRLTRIGWSSSTMRGPTGWGHSTWRTKHNKVYMEIDSIYCKQLENIHVNRSKLYL